MGIFISKTDFVGRYAIAQNSFTDLDLFITMYEEGYLVDMLGATLYGLFHTDCSGVPLAPGTPIYQSLFNPFNADDKNTKKIIKSRGIKEMLLGFIYFEYVKGQRVKNTVSGPVVNTGELSREAGYNEADTYSRFNDSVTTYEAISWFINKNIGDYPDYNGSLKKRAHWAA
jgi:hypothetical protein